MTDRSILVAFLAISSCVAVGSAFVVPHVTTGAAANRNLAIVSEAPHIGAGGMADTRDPAALNHEDARKSISEAPSFEEYLKMRQSGGDTTAAAAAPATVSSPAPVSAPAPAATTSGGGGGGGGSAEAAVATLDASQQNSVAAIATAIPDLAIKPDLAWTDGTIAGCPATLDARDAPGPANIAWLASLCIAGKESSLTIYNGPLNDVPHLLSRCCVVDNGATLSFVLDFRPRAYGAYEQKDAQGNYPGPEELGRKAFEYSGARSDYFNKFVTEDDVVAFLESTKQSFEGAVDTSAEMNALSGEEELLTQGPHKLSLTMPLTDGNVAAVVSAREKAANYWLGWATDGQHEHRPGAQVNTQYVYDSKYKINAYGALLPVYNSLYGPEDGTKLTAAVSGPLDEAYVGGGS